LEEQYSRAKDQVQQTQSTLAATKQQLTGAHTEIANLKQNVEQAIQETGVERAKLAVGTPCTQVELE
jgi:phage shock protein A